MCVVSCVTREGRGAGYASGHRRSSRSDRACWSCVTISSSLSDVYRSARLTRTAGGKARIRRESRAFGCRHTVARVSPLVQSLRRSGCPRDAHGPEGKRRGPPWIEIDVLAPKAPDPLDARGQVVSLGLGEGGKAVVQEEAGTSAALDSDQSWAGLQSVKVAGRSQTGRCHARCSPWGHRQNPDVAHHLSSAKRGNPRAETHRSNGPLTRSQPADARPRLPCPQQRARGHTVGDVNDGATWLSLVRRL
jgi:hypothetical protein